MKVRRRKFSVPRKPRSHLQRVVLMLRCALSISSLAIARTIVSHGHAPGSEYVVSEYVVWRPRSYIAREHS